MRRLSLQERRAELVDAAVRVIARDGLAAASTRAIVAEADMPLGAFHYAFESRDDLLAAVIDRVTDDERIAAWLVADDAVQGRDLDTVLRRGIEAYLALLEAEPSRELALLEVVTHGMRHDPPAARRQWAVYRVAIVESLRYAAQIADVEWTRPVEEIGRWMQATLDGITLAWLTDRDSDAARRSARLLAGSVAALASPRSDAAAAATAATSADSPTRIDSPAAPAAGATAEETPDAH